MTNETATETTDQELDDGRYVFISGALALDLVNTEVVVRGKAIDLIDSPAQYLAWWRAVERVYPEIVSSQAATESESALLPITKELRGSLRGVFGAIADGQPMPQSQLASLNRTLAAAVATIAFGDEGAPRAVYDAREALIDGPLLATARSAFTLLTALDLSRLHRCANDRCVLMFYDDTRSATRRWCSTACMNRFRSAENYKRLRGK